jgi:High potential iron-sulfur protein
VLQFVGVRYQSNFAKSLHKTFEVSMKNSSRRVFMLQVAAGSAALAAGAAQAQALPMVNEKDAQPMALGYAADTTKVDAKKYPKHVAAQKCSNCTLYAGKADAASGPCGIFPGKGVAANGWCSAYTKKA